MFAFIELLAILPPSLNWKLFSCDRYVYQKGYVEVFVSLEAFQGLLPKLKVGIEYQYFCIFPSPAKSC